MNPNKQKKSKVANQGSEPKPAKSWVAVNKKLDFSAPNSPTSGISNNSENNENYFSLDQNISKLESNDTNRNVKFDSPVKCLQRNKSKIVEEEKKEEIT
jgi:hypothetical protein